MQQTLFDSFDNTNSTASKRMRQTKPQLSNPAGQNSHNENIESQDCGISIYKTDDEKTKSCKYALIHIRTYYAELKEEIESWARQKFDEKENFSITFIAYQPPQRLGESGCITMDTQSEAVFHSGETSYRMGNYASNKAEVRQLLLGAYDEKRRELSIPYCDPNITQGFGLRSTKPENIKVFVSPKARDFILSLGVKLDKFLECYQGLDETIATENDIAETKRLKELEQEIEKEKAEYEQVKSVASNFFGIGYHYGKKEEDTSGVDIRGLAERFLELKKHIAEHEEMIEKIRNKYWECRAKIPERA